MTTKMTTQLKDLKKTGHCESCEKKAYLECTHCYFVLQYEGQQHNCPEKEKEPAVVRPIMCARSDKSE